MNSLPFYDDYDLSTVDILLISHFHLDHAASLPYVMERTNFKGRVFMTHPTKAIYRWLLGDFVRVSSAPDSQESLYTEADLSASFDRIETIDYHSTMEVNGIKFTAYHAGHVLGAAMYLVEIAGVKVLFTGDYSREEDRHLNPAEVPQQKVDVLITESTYGTGIHQQRLEKESRLTSLIHNTVKNGGRCLLPVFALGRAQEILLILDEYWESHPELEGINIYYASVLAKKCMVVFQTYINMMNDSIRERFRDSRTNPFHFKHIKSIKNLDRFEDIGPCVMVAAPGMLQNGVSRELLERWAPDSKNALIMTGYSVEGTLAKQILNEPVDIPSIHSTDTKIPRRCVVEEISFAAHVDYKQNATFIDLINAKHVILVHGETTNMNRLKSALTSKYNSRKGTDAEVTIYNPSNCVEVELYFKSIKVARVVGEMAQSSLIPISQDFSLTDSSSALTTTSQDLTRSSNASSIMVPANGKVISGVLVEKDFHLSLVTAPDLREYTSLTTSIVTERQSIVVNAQADLIRYHLEHMFGNVEVLKDPYDKSVKREDGEEDDEGVAEYKVMDAVKVIHKDNLSTIEWIGNSINDAIADAVLGLLISVDSSPASVKRKLFYFDFFIYFFCSNILCFIVSSKSCGHEHGDVKPEQEETKLLSKLKPSPPPTFDDKVEKVGKILQAQFGSENYFLAEDKKTATIKINEMEAVVSFEDFVVQCPSKPLQQRMSHVLERALYTVAPLAAPANISYQSSLPMAQEPIKTEQVSEVNKVEQIKQEEPSKEIKQES